MDARRVEFEVSDGVVVEVERRNPADHAEGGAPVVLVPSLGRGLEDFDHLAAALSNAGHSTLAVNPRSIAASRGPLDDLTLHDFAADVAGVVDSLDGGPAHLVGHAWGNRVVRCVAADRPDIVRSLILLAAGGLVEPEPAHAERMIVSFDPNCPAERRFAAVRKTFFAPGNDAEVWRDGWWLEAAVVEALANLATPRDDWWDPPADIPLLVVQGLDDAAAPPANGRQLVAGRSWANLVEVPGAGHALLPEQPAAIAASVVEHVNAR